MTWPFGGLPLGGVFLGQADGPLLQLARIGGPLLLTAGVWAGGVGLATLVCGIRHRERGPVPAMRGAVILVGLALCVLVATLSPDGGSPVRSITVALVQGGGRRGVDKAQVLTGHGLRRAGGSDRRPRPRSHRVRRWCCGPKTSSPSPGRCGDRARAARCPRWPAGCTRHLAAGVTEPASATTFRNEIVVWAPDGRIVGTFEKVHRVPFGEYVPYRSLIAHVADLSGVPTDASPGSRHRAAPHAGRPARHPRLLRGLLRRSQPHLGPGGRRAPDRPDQHLLVRHGPGSHPGGRRRRRPGGRDRARSGPGRAHRLQHGGRSPRAGAASARCWAGARS